MLTARPGRRQLIARRACRHHVLAGCATSRQAGGADAEDKVLAENGSVVVTGQRAASADRTRPNPMPRRRRLLRRPRR